MDSERRLITLTSEYRARLLDKLEHERPEAFKIEENAELARKAPITVANFLEREFKAAKLEFGETAFTMLLGDFVGSTEFEKRAERIARGELAPRESSVVNGRFLNVDLEVWSQESLQPLLDAFGADIFTLHHDCDFANLELSMHPECPVTALRRFNDLVQRLEGSALDIWNGAQKNFSVGFEANFPFQYRFSRAELVLATSMNATIEVALYRLEE